MPQITIADRKFEIPQRYTAGYVLQENEAQALNRTLAENARNNLASKIKEAGPDADQGQLQSIVDEYVQSYSFGTRRGGAAQAPRDPVKKEAYKIARAKVADRLKELGRTDLSAETIAKLANDLLERQDTGPGIMEEARRRVDAEKSIAVSEIQLPDEQVQGAEGDQQTAPRGRRGRAQAAA